MAYQGRGDSAQARIWLGKAETRLREEGKAGSGVEAILGDDWVDFQIMTREAQDDFEWGKVVIGG